MGTHLKMRLSKERGVSRGRSWRRMVGSTQGRETGGGWDLANTLVLLPHQHNMDGIF